jgi:glycerophosphoryl diester phosphodiesterase
VACADAAWQASGIRDAGDSEMTRRGMVFEGVRSDPADPRPAVADPGRVIAHRGASQVAPENTLAAFRAAVGQGARWIEFDVSLLGDGTPVVFHDPTLDRCTDAAGPLSSIGRDDLGRISAGARHGVRFAGEPIPTLEAALDLIDALGISANLEIKRHADALGAPAAAVVRALGQRPWAADRIVTSSFDLDELAAFRAALPAAPLAVLYTRPPRDWQKRLAALRAEALHLQHDELTPGLLADATAAGFRVRVYTINRPELMVPFRGQGLTSVITDHPPLFLEDPAWAEWARS